MPTDDTDDTDDSESDENSTPQLQPPPFAFIRPQSAPIFDPKGLDWDMYLADLADALAERDVIYADEDGEERAVNPLSLDPDPDDADADGEE